MLSQILQEIENTPEQQSMYHQAILAVLRRKSCIKQCIDILNQPKIKQKPTLKMLEALQRAYSNLISDINSSIIFFEPPINFVGLINDALNLLESFYNYPFAQTTHIWSLLEINYFFIINPSYFYELLVEW